MRATPTSMRVRTKSSDTIRSMLMAGPRDLNLGSSSLETSALGAMKTFKT